MKFATRSTHSPRRARPGAAGGFTLAEVLVALLFMAIVIPVTVQGLRIASLAGEVAQRKSAAARVAERILNENIVTTNWSQSVQTGTVEEGATQYHWTRRQAAWDQDPMRVLSVEVKFTAQDRDCVVRLSTLVGLQ